MMTNPLPTARREGNYIIIPGLATAHSHAFQRALRGRTQRPDTGADSFWSWRALMYALAEKLDPDDMFHIARFAFTELAMSGVTAVGEFHYVHHAPGGRPYAERTTMAEAVIRAARKVGLRITLIRTAYMRAGYQEIPSPAQKRFADLEVESILADVDLLRNRCENDPFVRIALAAHSIRAVPQREMIVLADYARENGLMFHMHVAEQWNEVRQCLREYGMRPIDLLTKADVLHPNFVAIHATHLSRAEIHALGRAESFVCLCRTTERDLGDGLPETASIIQAGVKLCVGVDSHASSDAFEEIRAVELDDRSHNEARHTVSDGIGLLQMGTQFGYEAIGMDQAWPEDQVYLRANDPSVAGINNGLLPDGIVFGATPRAVDEVIVGGRRIIEGGVHPQYDEALQGYEKTLKKLNLL